MVLDYRSLGGTERLGACTNQSRSTLGKVCRILSIEVVYMVYVVNLNTFNAFDYVAELLLLPS